MRIYGKTLRQIWPDIPTPQKVVVVAGTAFIAFTILYFTTRSIVAMVNAQAPHTGALEIASESATNFFDPSAATDGQTAALAYTSLTPVSTRRPAADAGGETVAQADLQMAIGIATSNNGCKKWRHIQDVFTAKPDTLLAPDGTSKLAEGEIRYETPSIVYDPGDPAMPWKVFAYRYFWMGNPAFAQRYGMIVMRGAKTALGPWGDEKWLLGTAPDYPPPPYQNRIGNLINPMNAALSGITSYTRPSVQADGNVMLMTLAAFRGNDIDRVILLASLDHGSRWVYAGTLLQKQDLAQIKGGPFTRITGASLLREGKTYYLAAVLGNAETLATGTYLFRVQDVAKAQLARSEDGAPLLTRHLPRQSVEPTAQGGGHAAFAQGCPDGIITAEHSGTRNRWQLFRTATTPATSSKD